MGVGTGHALLALLLCLLPGSFVHAERTEAEVKAAFVYNFAKFVEWPESSLGDKQTLVLCTLFDPKDVHKLELLQGREAQGREIRVKALSLGEPWADCQMLFIGLGDRRQRLRLLHSLHLAPVLTISDAPDFAEQGGMIGLFVQSNRVQFAVNLPAAQQAGFKLSARLLQMARIVQPAMAGAQP